MRIEELAASVKRDKESGFFSLQAIIDRHLANIEQLKSEGYAYAKLFEILELGIKKNHFQNLLARAKKKVATKSPTPQNHRAKTHHHETSNQATAKTPLTNFSKSQWADVGIRSEFLLKMVGESELTPNDIKSWGCANEMQIAKRLTEEQIRRS